MTKKIPAKVSNGLANPKISHDELNRFLKERVQKLGVCAPLVGNKVGHEKVIKNKIPKKTEKHRNAKKTQKKKSKKNEDSNEDDDDDLSSSSSSSTSASSLSNPETTNSTKKHDRQTNATEIGRKNSQKTPKEHVPISICTLPDGYGIPIAKPRRKRMAEQVFPKIAEMLLKFYSCDQEASESRNPDENTNILKSLVSNWQLISDNTQSRWRMPLPSDGVTEKMLLCVLFMPEKIKNLLQLKIWPSMKKFNSDASSPTSLFDIHECKKIEAIVSLLYVNLKPFFDDGFRKLLEEAKRKY